MRIIESVKEREPFFDGWETDKAVFNYSCDQCKASIVISFKDMLNAAWGWIEKTKEDQKTAIAAAFGIDLEDKFIGNGMSSVVTKVCPKCNQTHHIFFWFHEYRNSCYRIVFKGLAVED